MSESESGEIIDPQRAAMIRMNTPRTLDEAVAHLRQKTAAFRRRGRLSRWFWRDVSSVEMVLRAAGNDPEEGTGR